MEDAGLVCVVHCRPTKTDAKKAVKLFTKTRWQKAISSAHEWIKLDGCEQEVGLSKDLISKREGPSAQDGFHDDCYCSFTNKERRARLLLKQNEKQKVVEPPKKTPKPTRSRPIQLRSKEERETPSSHVFSPGNKCIICRRSRTARDNVTGSRKQLPLVQVRLHLCH